MTLPNCTTIQANIKPNDIYLTGCVLFGECNTENSNPKTVAMNLKDSFGDTSLKKIQNARMVLVNDPIYRIIGPDIQNLLFPGSIPDLDELNTEYNDKMNIFNELIDNIDTIESDCLNISNNSNEYDPRKAVESQQKVFSVRNCIGGILNNIKKDEIKNDKHITEILGCFGNISLLKAHECANKQYFLNEKIDILNKCKEFLLDNTFIGFSMNTDDSMDSISFKDYTKEDIHNHISKKRRKTLSSKAAKVLITWFDEHFHYPYPSMEEKYEISKKAGISIYQINNWFINRRGRCWKPKIEKILQENASGKSEQLEEILVKISEPIVQRSKGLTIEEI